jgi:hypothetical protein
MNQMQHEKLVGQVIVDISRLHLDTLPGGKGIPALEFYSVAWKVFVESRVDTEKTYDSFYKVTAHLAVTTAYLMHLHGWIDLKEREAWFDNAHAALIWGERMRVPLFKSLEKRLEEIVGEHENAKFTRAMGHNVDKMLRKACVKDAEAPVVDEPIQAPVEFNKEAVAETMPEAKPSPKVIARKCNKAYKAAVDSGTDPDTADEIAAALAAELGGEWKSKTRKGAKAAKAEAI